jgi:hypothetical protein
MAEGLLKFAGLCLECGKNEITAQAASSSTCLPLMLSDLKAELGPLFLALCVRTFVVSDEQNFMNNSALFPRTEDEIALAGEFFSRLGLNFRPGFARGGKEETGAETRDVCFWELHRQDSPDHAVGEHLTRGHGRRARSVAWTCPDAYWGMAFALAAFARPGLILANPGAVTEKNPVFWEIYNSLPDPRIRVPAWEEPGEKSCVPNPRRRLKAD